MDKEKKLYYKEKGSWKRPLPDPACAFSMAFGGDGSFFVRDCFFSYLHKLQKNGKWFLHGTGKEIDYLGIYKGKRRSLRLVKNIPKVLDFAVDSRGYLWMINMSGQVVRYNAKKNKWV